MRAEVDLADVVVLQHGGVSGVGSVVSGAVVEGAAGGEGQAGVQSVLLDQLPGAFLQPLAGRGGREHALVHSEEAQPQRGTARKRRLGVGPWAVGRLTRFRSWSFRVA